MCIAEKVPHPPGLCCPAGALAEARELSARPDLGQVMQAARSQLWSRLTGSPLQAAEVQARLEVSMRTPPSVICSLLRQLPRQTGASLPAAGLIPLQCSQPRLLVSNCFSCLGHVFCGSCVWARCLFEVLLRLRLRPCFLNMADAGISGGETPLCLSQSGVDAAFILLSGASAGCSGWAAGHASDAGAPAGHRQVGNSPDET